MGNVFNLLPLFSAVFVFVLGITVFLKSKRKRINVLFSIFAFIIGIWLVGSFMLIISKTAQEAFFWDKLNYAVVIFIPSVVYHFAVEFAGEKKNKIKLIVLGYLLSTIFLIFNLITNLFIDGVYEYSWGFHAKAQIVHHFFIIFFAFYLAMMFFEIGKVYRRSDGIEKERAKFELLALAILTTGSIGFLPAYGISVMPFSYLSGLFFAIIAGYAITRYRLLEIRIFTIHILIITLNLLTFVYIFVSGSFREMFARAIFFVGVLFISLLLKRGFDKELQQKMKLKNLIKELEQTNKKLIELDKAKNEFISIAAHQLRTPPTVIKGYITMALEEIDNGKNKSIENVEEFLERALRSNERLIELVEDILDISRIESGKIQYHFEDDQDCEEILDNLFKSFEVRADEKGLKLEFKKITSPLPKIRMDGKRIREVVSNLIDNAIKYTPKGKVVLTQKLSKDGKKIRIEVSDTGVGIAKKDMPGLFKKFARGTDTERLGADGTGLGIYVGKRIVEAHHGKIWAESEGVNKGSKFIVELPVKWKKEWRNKQ